MLTLSELLSKMKIAQETATLLSAPNPLYDRMMEEYRWSQWQNRSLLRRLVDSVLRREPPPKPESIKIKIKLPEDFTL